MDTNGLENQNVRFYLNAPDNSPIWGSVYDMVEWLRNWHIEGCRTGENIVPEPPLPIIAVDLAKAGSDVTVVAIVEEKKVVEVLKVDQVYPKDPYGSITFKGNKYTVRHGKLVKKKVKA